MPIISQLSAAQLARHAFNVFLFSGRHVTGARLIYHSLVLDHYQPLAIRCLSDLLDSDLQTSNGTEVFSAVALEYALAPSTPISEDARRELDDLLFLSKWSWAFSKHQSGSLHLDAEAFKDRTQFVIDEERYQNFLQGAIRPAGSLADAFRAAHTVCGAMGGLIAHSQLGGKAPIEESFYPERFQRTTDYDLWLSSNTTELDALENARQEKTHGV